jgi:hypothetical protein
VIVRTWLVNRVGSLIPGGVVVTAAVVSLVEQDSVRIGHVIAFALITAPTAFLVVRAFRAAVVLRDDSMTIRGWWWSRSVPRDRVVRVSDGGWLIWRARDGREVRSPLAIFWNYDDARFVPLASHNEQALATIRRWISGGAA